MVLSRVFVTTFEKLAEERRTRPAQAEQRPHSLAQVFERATKSVLRIVGHG